MQSFQASRRTEYLTESEFASNGNGDTAPPKKRPFDLREQVCKCNDANLTTFAKLLFCRLTDMAFLDRFKRADGCLDVSKEFLAGDFAKSVDTVTRATRLLERSGFIWTKAIWNGSFEITRWFIRDWADDKNEYSSHTGANFGRRVDGVQRNTVRNAGGRFAPNPDSQRQKTLAALMAGASAPTVKAEISPEHGQKSALSGPTNQPCQGAEISPVRADQSALSGCKNQPCHGAEISPDTAQISALTRRNIQPCQGEPLPGNNTLQTDQESSGGVSFKRSTGFNAPKAGGKTRKASAENIFLLDVGAMCEHWQKGSSKAELSGSGAWWRLGFRTDPDLMQRVLADTLCAVKEGRIKTTPGQMAADTWSRWGGTLPAK